MKAAEKDIASFKLKRKRAMAQSVITASTAAGGAVGAIPLPFADAAILVPVESGLVTALRKIYGIPDGDDAQKIMDTILEVGTASIGQGRNQRTESDTRRQPCRRSYKRHRRGSHRRGHWRRLGVCLREGISWRNEREGR